MSTYRSADMKRKQLGKGITIKVSNPNVKARHWLPTLTEPDIQLVSVWNQSVHSNLNRQSIIENYGKYWKLGRLLSARSAEKVAAEFYGNYGKTVRDISITQIDENPQSDWKLYDLDVEGVPVDVKNSRAYKNGENRYSEYCIPQFKRDRKNQEVTIAGVFSPYLRPFEILEPTEYLRSKFNSFLPPKAFDYPDIEYPRTLKTRFLGETTQAKHGKLRDEFNPLLDFRSVSPESKSFLPPWLFDYPKYVYTKQNRARKDLKNFPDLDLLKEAKFEFNLFPACIAAGIDFAEVRDNTVLNSWEGRFLGQLRSRINRYGLSLPFVFLTVLEHFLNMAASSKSDSNFNPDRYRRFLFCEETDQPLEPV